MRITIMNKLTKTLSTIVLTLSTIGMANAANSVVAADDYVTTNLCVVAAEGDRIKMHKAIKDSRLSKNFIAENVTCNDQNILAFVEAHAENPTKINNLLMNGQYDTEVKITDLAAVQY